MQREKTYISKITGKRVSMTDIHYKLLLPKRQKEYIEDEQSFEIPTEYGRSHKPQNKKQSGIGKRGGVKAGKTGVN